MVEAAGLLRSLRELRRTRESNPRSPSQTREAHLGGLSVLRQDVDARDEIESPFGPNREVADRRAKKTPK